MNQISNTISTGTTTSSLYTSSTQTQKMQLKDGEQSQQINSTNGAVDIVSTATGSNTQVSKTTGSEISPAYTVEISAEGSHLSNSTADNLSAASATANTSDTETVQSSGSSAASSTSSTSENSTSTLDSDSTSDTSDLSIYSDYQLKQMLTDEKISQSEYNAETAKREAKNQETAITKSENTATINSVNEKSIFSLLENTQEKK